jgi:hypothetical protein
MSKGNNARDKIAQPLSQAQELISEAMALLGDDTPAAAEKQKKPTAKKSSGDLDFTTPIRPFVKRHAAGMNGAAKFTLLVAHLVQGDESETISLSDVEGQWNKMTNRTLLGMKYNRLYSSEANNNDWVHAPAKGVYQLRPSWRDILG